MALTGLQIQKLLPKTNCKECGCSTCLAFAMKLASKKAALKECPHASEEAKQILGAAAEPPIRTVAVGTGEKPFKAGGETILYRHEKTFVNQTGLGVSLDDVINDDQIEQLVQTLRDYKLERVGEILRLDAISVTHKSGNITRFVAALEKVAAIFDRSYRQGPISDSYLAGHHFTLAFEKPTKADTFRRRHHLRLWRTPYKIMGRRVWAGTVSYDRAAGTHDGVLPTHHIAPTLSWEEGFLAGSLGIHRPRHLTLDEPYKGELNNGDTYDYDGKALVLDLSGFEL